MYGNEFFENYLEKLKAIFPTKTFEYYQNNVEGEFINAMQQYVFSYDGIIFNQSGNTHTSFAIGDAVAAITTKVIEVHISNIFGREECRKISHVSANCVGVISGLGLKGYELGVRFMVEKK